MRRWRFHDRRWNNFNRLDDRFSVLPNEVLSLLACQRRSSLFCTVHDGSVQAIRIVRVMAFVESGPSVDQRGLRFFGRR